MLLTGSPVLRRAATCMGLPTIAMFRVALAVGILTFPALAFDNGRFNHSAPEVRDWFRAQKSPKTGEHCCDEADGTYAEEDIRDGHYWVRWSTVGEWQRVPDDVIINSPNRMGVPVVWWHYDHLGVKIRCYVPGGKT